MTVTLPRYPLAFLPTPLHPLPRLSATLHARGAPASELPSFQLWIKRDDQTGLAGGGNKTRKLELLLADALAQGCDTLLTTGAVQSNHCRQTAAAAARAGLACHLVLGGEPPAQPNGNFLLDRLLGAALHWTTRENRLNRLHALADELRAEGRRPYVITYGGSDPVGASGYALAMAELFDQARVLDLRLDVIVVASSSGGTQAGMVAGTRTLGWDVPILGISIDETQGGPAGQGRRPGDAHRGPPRPGRCLHAGRDPGERQLSRRRLRHRRRPGAGGGRAHGADRGHPARSGLHRPGLRRADRPAPYAT